MRTKQNLKHLIKVDFMGIRTKIKNFQKPRKNNRTKAYKNK
jgi:hypothetical protein